MDNRTTAMTGHQEHPGTGHTLQGEETLAVSFADMARAMGIRHVCTVDPYDLTQVEEALESFLNVGEPAVIVAQRECVLLPEARDQWKTMQLDTDMCMGCGLCYEIGCPALVEACQIDPDQDYEPGIPWVDPLLCTGCGICAQVCVGDAFQFP
jgi:indolepyruvate ferredoxin oxidoreductase alpha subunit